MDSYPGKGDILSKQIAVKLPKLKNMLKSVIYIYHYSCIVILCIIAFFCTILLKPLIKIGQFIERWLKYHLEWAKKPKYL